MRHTQKQQNDNLLSMLALMETQDLPSFKAVLQQLYIDKRDIEAIVSHSDYMLFTQLAYNGRLEEFAILVEDFQMPQERAHRTLLTLAADGKYDKFSRTFPFLEPLIDRISLAQRIANFDEHDDLRKLVQLLRKHHLLGAWDVSNPVVIMLFGSAIAINKHRQFRVLHEEFGMPADFLDSYVLRHAVYNTLPTETINYWVDQGARMESRCYVSFLHLLTDGRYEDMVALLPKVNMNAETIARILRINFPDTENLEKHLKRFIAYED